MFKREKSSNKHVFRVFSAISDPSVLPFGVPLGAAIIAGAIFFAYFPSIHGGFIWDDTLLLTENKIIPASDGLYRIWCSTQVLDYWPVTNTSFWLEWRLWGLNPTGYHVTNMLLHVVEALMVWIILRKMSIPGAFFAALIFAVHPVNVESVAWIASRKSLMAMLFYLLSILWYLKFMERARVPLAAKQTSLNHLSLIPRPSSFYWLSLAAFVLAMLSKGSVAVLPIMLIGIIWWQRDLTKWDMVRIAPFFVIAIVLAVVNMWFQTHGSGVEIRSASFAQRILGAGCVVWFYLYKARLPIDLSFVYPQWDIEAGNPVWWLPLAAAVIVTAVLWRYKNTWSWPLLFAWGYFCAALVPVMGFTDVFFMRYSLVADHYQHIALIGAVAIAAGCWSTWHKYMPPGERLKPAGAAVQQSPQRAAHCRQCAATVLAVVASVTLAILTWRQSGLYRDEATLYQDTLEKNPHCWMARNNLGLVFFKAGRMQEAMEHFRQVLQIKPDNAEAYNNIGAILDATGKQDEAIEHYKQALLLKPNYLDAHCNLGNAFKALGRYQQAIEHYERALAINPYNAEIQCNLSTALVQTGRLPESIQHYERALALKPDNTETLNNLGAALIQTGRPRDALVHFKKALLLKPDYPEAHYNLGFAFNALGQYQQAIEHYEEALRLQPDFALVYTKLALTYAGTNQSAKAVATARNALELARSKGNAEHAKEIEDWLKSYQRGIGD